MLLLAQNAKMSKLLYNIPCSPAATTDHCSYQVFILRLRSVPFRFHLAFLSHLGKMPQKCKMLRCKAKNALHCPNACFPSPQNATMPEKCRMLCKMLSSAQIACFPSAELYMLHLLNFVWIRIMAFLDILLSINRQVVGCRCRYKSGSSISDLQA